MDDLLTGADTLEEAKLIQAQIIDMLRKGGFNLRKWSASNVQLLEDLSEDKLSQSTVDFDQDKKVKTLGVLWNPSQDSFSFAINSPDSTHEISKRTVLSIIARIFDPLGLLGPVILKAKLLMQILWQLGVGWDDTLPNSFTNQWEQFCVSLADANLIEIPRSIVTNPLPVSLQLHGFCDASQLGYGACLYLRAINDAHTISTSLVISKSRVAPLKAVSLPRLELCGAMLLAELTTKTIDSLKLKINEVHFWTDSTIVLAWINSPSSHWTTFVSNRVSKIQELTNINSWHHVEGAENPADLVSRGLFASEIAENKLWWNGPDWLSENQINCSDYTSPNIEVPERRERLITLHSKFKEDLIDNLISRCSTLSKLVRVFAYTLRFIHNVQGPSQRYSGSLATLEFNNALIKLVQHVQRNAFHLELNQLNTRHEVSKDSKLAPLAPILDKDTGLILVGGRLKNSLLTSDQKHPIVLPKGNKINYLIAKDLHSRNSHCGSQTLLYLMRQRYWPLEGRSLTKRVISQCLPCFKAKPDLAHQLMGNLPPPRVQLTKPFQHTGVDFCGPFLVKTSKRRGITPSKTYLALFVCLSVKAYHFELVEDLTTESFIAAMRRFMSRRGKPSHMYSDNATNFIGAEKELKDLQGLWSSDSHLQRLQDVSSYEGITWHFIPPRAPHFGGLWESGVRMVKTHLRRVAGTKCMTIYQFHTLITQIEACINSRPITSLSNDPNDLSPLCPSHFLIGDVLSTCGQADLRSVPHNRLNLWQEVQQTVQHFWHRWSTDYLNGLQQRAKWRTRQENIEVGALVLVKEDGQPPLSWLLGRVEEIHRGADDLVRVVSLRTRQGVFKRPITKLCPLKNCE